MVLSRQLPTRQRIRAAILLLSFLLFPITLYYFSPALILQGAAAGVVNGSFIVFTLMFLASLFIGRLWCGWVCPAGALQEIGRPLNDKRTPGGKFNWTKWFIWTPWIVLIVVLAVQAGGYRTIDPFYQIETKMTMTLPAGDGPSWTMIYYIIIALFLGMALLFGRRAGCHTVCWMAPFMILGRNLANRLHLPGLRLVANADRCRHCMTCSRGCPMSLDVHDMVQQHDMENAECILCGTCVDNCNKDAIHFTVSTK